MFVNASNNAVAKLSSNINSSQTSLTVDDASIFPDTPFLITVNEEIMRVTSVSGNSLTVQRGREGTIASSHNAGSNVENNLTAGTYQALVDEIQALNQRLETAVFVEEEGSNSNGSYIRYSDGRQICYGRVKLTNRAGSSAGNYRILEDWEFPREFIDNDYTMSATIRTADIGTSIESVTHLRVNPITDPGTTNKKVGIVAARSDGERNVQFDSGSEVVVDVVAIGRWK